MDSQVCICCGGRITVASSRNPNLCLSCEQLVEDESVELDRLLFSLEAVAGTANARIAKGEEAPASAGW